ncbi:hypothetical protein BC835DRAFT_5853 [Cytidiella melzeri]|nr:hypothetical protein BC835DRAFT_5853 [Cytidiella melzeri]
MVFGPLPNLSDTAALSESSFQIPNALGSTSQLLLGDDCDDFLAGMDTTLSTPAPSTSTKLRSIDHNPLTLAELTPRSRQTKAQTLRYTSSSRKPTIPSLLKRTVARDLSTAMDDTLSAFRHPPDYSFQIPKIGGDVTQLLLAEDDLELLSKGSDCSFPNVADSTVQLNEDLTLSQLTPESRPAWCFLY